MEMLSVFNNSELQQKLANFMEEKKVNEDEVICTLVYEFASKLPYSMDYMDQEFVPGFFLNVKPANPSIWLFKEYNSLYDKMIDWGDTKKSGILLQVCYIFQAMLMGNFPNNYQMTEEDFHHLGISQTTGDDEYNRLLFETLGMLPEYCARLNSAKTDQERRNILDVVYAVMVDKVGQKIGGVRETTISKDVISVKEHKATINLFPHKDLDMLYYFERIRYDFSVRDLIEDINRNLIGNSNPNNGVVCLESEDKKVK